MTETKVYEPFLPESDRICYYECTRKQCRAGARTMLNDEINPTIERNHFELRANQLAPTKGNFIDFKKCPVCEQMTLVRA